MIDLTLPFQSSLADLSFSESVIFRVWLICHFQSLFRGQISFSESADLSFQSLFRGQISFSESADLLG